MENYYDPIEEQFNNIQASKKNQSVTKKKKVEFDVKNYLNVKLSSNETEKEITVRILKLTPDLDTDEPLFKLVHMHFLPSANRSYVCTKQTTNLSEGVDKNCPFCDIRDEAKDAQKGASTAEWNKLKEVYKQNGSMLNYIVRVVDRDDENFGVKFWKFSEPVYKMIKSIWKNNKSDDIDIFDYENGKDLVITIEKSKDGKSKITNVAAKNKQTPLANTKERINELETDEKVWTDVYGIKPYEYLEILINGGEPFYDKTIGKWVEKKEKEEDATDEEYEDNYHTESGSGEEEHGEYEEDLPF